LRTIGFCRELCNGVTLLVGYFVQVLLLPWIMIDAIIIAAFLSAQGVEIIFNRPAAIPFAMPPCCCEWDEHEMSCRSAPQEIVYGCTWNANLWLSSNVYHRGMGHTV